MSAHSTRRILGIDFFVGPIEQAVNQIMGVIPGTDLNAKDSEVRLHASGFRPQVSGLQSRLIVAPSAPGLAVDLVKSPSYREALTTADLAITDSGFMVLLWRLYTGEKLPRHSGLKLIRAVLERPELKQPGSVFWVMPSASEDARNRAWLVDQGFPVTADDVYIAPHYAPGPITDDELVRRIATRRPRIVMLAIGGGVQERVGLMLRDRIGSLKPETGNLKAEGSEFENSGFRFQPSGFDPHSGPTSQLSAFSPQVSGLSDPSGFSFQVSALDQATSGPAILCLGAAIAFLTGGQVGIPPWADRLILGWLFRLVSAPRKFWRRYWEALGLARLLWRYRERLPAAKET
jgi:UDP-N-acetyl-D-mannosaminuronic acid transferase (WecB/TagA/CpsF family)